MKLSTKGRYGVRMMIDLASHYGEGPVLLREIANRQEISEKYLPNLINPLKATGLLEATRGVHGGYMLGKAPPEITMKDIVLAVEGPMCLVDCVEKPVSCNRTSLCIAHELWREAAEGACPGFWGNTPWPTWWDGRRPNEITLPTTTI